MGTVDKQGVVTITRYGLVEQVEEADPRQTKRGIDNPRGG